MKISLISGGIALATFITLSGPAWADPCPDNPDAIGTSRVMMLDPAETPRLGTLNYSRTLELAPGEVVLTFDDGPQSPNTQRVLETLAKHCVKATFFMIGRNAKIEPETARLVLAAGHTIGTHTQNHPLQVMTAAQAQREIATGILTVGAALGEPRAVAPFFRFPGLHRTALGERFLRRHSIAAWSIDVDSHDWMPITAERVVENVMTRLAAKGHGVVLLHDVQSKTARILPALLATLKQRGYRIVHVVAPERPATPPSELLAMPVPDPAAQTFGVQAAKAAANPPKPRLTAATAPKPPHMVRAPQHAKPARPIKASAVAPHRHAVYR